MVDLPIAEKFCVVWGDLDKLIGLVKPWALKRFCSTLTIPILWNMKLDQYLLVAHEG